MLVCGGGVTPWSSRPSLSQWGELGAAPGGERGRVKSGKSRVKREEGLEWAASRSVSASNQRGYIVGLCLP